MSIFTGKGACAEQFANPEAVLVVDETA